MNPTDSLPLHTHSDAIADCESPHLSDMELESGSESELESGSESELEYVGGGGMHMNMNASVVQSVYPVPVSGLGLETQTETQTRWESDVLLAYETAHQAQSLLLVIGGHISGPAAVYRNAALHRGLYGDSDMDMDSTLVPDPAPMSVRSVSKSQLFAFLNHSLRDADPATDSSGCMGVSIWALKERFQHYCGSGGSMSSEHPTNPTLYQSMSVSVPMSVPVVDSMSDVDNLLHALGTMDIMDAVMHVYGCMCVCVYTVYVQ